MDRALVIRLSSLGDVVLTTPVLAHMKAIYPALRLTVLTRRALGAVFAGNPHVDAVWAFEDRGWSGWAREIRRHRFDLVLDLHDTLRSRFWSFFSGADQRLRYDKRAAARRRLVWWKQRSSTLESGVVDRYLEPLQSWGPVADRRPRLYVPPNETLSTAVERDLESGSLVAVAPGAAHATKRWWPERFAEAADRIAGEQKNGRVVLLGAVGDRSAAEDVHRRLNTPVVDLVGRTSLREMILVLNRCRVLLTNDSGAMHVGAALGVPTVAVFGPTVREFGFFPVGPRTAVAEGGALPCRPCSLHGRSRCPERHFRCMADVTVDRVVDLARRVQRP